MKLIAHRGLWTDPSEQNSANAIRLAFEAGYDVETDVRSYQGSLYLSHDPIVDVSRCLKFEVFLSLAKAYPGRRVFLNIKEDGLIRYFRAHLDQISELQFIFFDMSVPELVQYAKVFSASQLCTRLSDFELRPAAVELCDWIWIDGFFKDPDLSGASVFLAQKRKSVALVSPELHGRSPEGLWSKLAASGLSEKEAVSLCTDSCTFAERYFSPRIPLETQSPNDKSHSL